MDGEVKKKLVRKENKEKKQNGKRLSVLIVGLAGG